MGFELFTESDIHKLTGQHREEKHVIRERDETTISEDIEDAVFIP